MDFKEAYQFPLEFKYGKVFTSNFKMAFDFIPSWMEKEDRKLFKVTEDVKHRLVAIVNGSDDQIKKRIKFRYENGTIYANDLHFIWVRGWGYLTGVGGLHLDDKTAFQLMDDFGNFIVERFKSAQTEYNNNSK